ncbi:MAG: ectonucleotide pyrophosphatase/phosphodiesterase [Clostridiaceae bacterium]|nr:ectonucleotide pyrophosphatase/phosphodiesterase [Clostridiaceae bacterium]
MKAKYMVIISFDAVSSEDVDILNTMPNFNKLISEGSLIANVKSVYPSLTYPAHATIVTGKYPKNHGIIDNTKFVAGDLSPDWYWYRKDVKGDTFYDLARQKGMKTCSILWPVTAKAKINYNFPEIFPTKPYHNQLLMSLTGGSPCYEYRLNKKYGHLRKGLAQPELDRFVLACAKDTILRHKPNLMMIHFTDVDTNRHLYGYRNDKIKAALKRHDKRLGEIIDALKKAGIYEETDIIALGDHSQIDVHSIVKINKLLLENKLIKLDENNQVVDYEAMCKSLDGSCYIYLKNKHDQKLHDKVYEILTEFKNLYPGVIEKIYDNKHIDELGADTNAEFIIEGREGYYFIDEYMGDPFEKVIDENVGKLSHRYKGIHGYSPDKERYGTFFIANGKDFKKGVVLKNGQLINHGPTIAKVLGVELKDTDGIVVDEIIE